PRCRWHGRGPRGRWLPGPWPRDVQGLQGDGHPDAVGPRRRGAADVRRGGLHGVDGRLGVSGARNPPVALWREEEGHGGGEEARGRAEAEAVAEPRMHHRKPLWLVLWGGRGEGG